MGRITSRLKDLIFTQLVTNVLTDLGDADSVTFFPPSSFDGTITLEVAAVLDPVEDDFITLQSGGLDVNLTAGKALILTDLSFLAARLSSTVSETNKKVAVVIQRSA